MKIFITGGTAGIGLALAKYYLKAGHYVAVCGRSLEKLPEEVISHSHLKSYQVDVTHRDELISAVNEFAQGSLDLMIANAGRSVGSKSNRPDFEAAKNVIDINVHGLFHTFEAAYNIMEKQKRGQIVALGSIAGMMGLGGAGPYSASKAAVNTLCESYRIDWAAIGIDITCICPGFIDTPLTRKNDHKMPFLMNSDKAAKLIAGAIAGRKAIYIFPWPMKIAAIFLSRIPRCFYRFLMSAGPLDYSKKEL